MEMEMGWGVGIALRVGVGVNSFHFPSYSYPLPGPSQLDVSQGPWGGKNCCLLFVLLLPNGKTEISWKELGKRDTVPRELAGHRGSCR